MKKVPVYNKEVMMKLVRKGFDVIDIVDNNKNPKFKVFLFISTPELLEALEECK